MRANLPLLALVAILAGQAAGPMAGLVFDAIYGAHQRALGHFPGDYIVSWGDDGPYRVHQGEKIQPEPWPNPAHRCIVTDEATGRFLRFAYRER